MSEIPRREATQFANAARAWLARRCFRTGPRDEHVVTYLGWTYKHQTLEGGFLLDREARRRPKHHRDPLKIQGSVQRQRFTVQP